MRKNIDLPKSTIRGLAKFSKMVNLKVKPFIERLLINYVKGRVAPIPSTELPKSVVVDTPQGKYFSDKETFEAGYNQSIEDAIEAVRKRDTNEPSEDYLFSSIISLLQQLKKTISNDNRQDTF